MRNIGLDLLRLLAVLLVMGRHLPPPPPSAHPVFRYWHTGGWVGVDLFFVLSGYLVAGLLFREYLRHGEVRVGRFLIRRAFKLYPAFWVMIAFTVGILIAHGQPFPTAGFLAEMLFVQNYFTGLWNHTWSLGVEEHFYLLLGLVVALSLRLSNGRQFNGVPAIFALVALGCLALRMFWYADPAVSGDLSWVFFTHLRIDALMFGVLLAWLTAFHGLEQRMRRIPALALLGLGTALLAPAFLYEFQQHMWMNTIGLTMVYLGAGCWVLAAVRLAHTGFVPTRVFAALGATSYSIYLWHMPVIAWGVGWFMGIANLKGTAAYLTTYLLGTLVVGYVLSQLVEWPMLRLRDRWFPSRERPAAQTQASAPSVVAG